MREQLEHPDITCIERTGYPRSRYSEDSREHLNIVEYTADEAEERTDDYE